MKSPQFPTSIRAKADVDGEPLAMAWFLVTLQMTQKNPYRLLFGPALPDGTLRITRDAINSQVQRVRDLFLMDYVDPSLAWSGRMEIAPMDRVAIERVLSTYSVYGGAGVYQPEMQEHLLELADILASIEGRTLSVDVAVEDGDGVTVTTVAKRI